MTLPNNIINNIDVDKLPDNVQDAVLDEFKCKNIKDRLIIYSRLIHGFLFKVTCNDLFNITKNIPSKVYTEFIDGVKGRLDESQSNDSEEI